MKISACWITKNESANVRLSIESLKNIVDEMVVVDTGSTDDTVAVAKELGARVEFFEWIDDFSAARNYTLSLVTGEIIIFLDADEWFDPPLGPSDRKLLERLFIKNPELHLLSIPRDNYDVKSGVVQNRDSNARIYRNRDIIRYKGRIHERVNLPSKKNKTILDALFTKHSGYSAEVIKSKISRNIEILRQELDDAPIGSPDRIFTLLYLIRESYNLGGGPKIPEYLTEVLKYPKELKELKVTSGETFMGLLYMVILAASKYRDNVSRRDIYMKMIRLIKTEYPQHPGAATIDLVYLMLFEHKEDKFLREIDPAIAVASKLSSSTTFHKQFDRLLYEHAAEACKRRGDNLRAMDYAMSALKIKANRKPFLVHILLLAIKGQPLEDIVLFLNSLFDVNDPDDLLLLTKSLKLDGFKELYIYYLSKRIALLNVPGDIISFLLVTGKFEELVSTIAKIYSDGDKDVVVPHMLLAALCGAPPKLIEAHREVLGDYGHIVDAFYSREPLTELHAQDMIMLQRIYEMVAFTAGNVAADRLLAVFQKDPKRCFMIKALHCQINGLPELLLQESIRYFIPFDFTARQFVIQALIDTRRFDEALAEIQGFLDKEYTSLPLLHMLLVVAELAPGETGQSARKLYEEHIAIYDDQIDLRDIVNTGIVFDEGGAKQKRAFKNMTQDQFDKRISTEKERFALRGQLQPLLRQAADVYLQNGISSEAAICLSRLIAHECAESEDYEKLAGIFEDLNNTALPEYIRALSARG